jgi:hypothetical protein
MILSGGKQGVEKDECLFREVNKGDNHVGYRFFVLDKVLGIYLFPWALYAIGSLIGFFSNAILSFIEGLNRIETIQKVRLGVSVLNTIILAVVLVIGGIDICSVN